MKFKLLKNSHEIQSVTSAIEKTEFTQDEVFAKLNHLTWAITVDQLEEMFKNGNLERYFNSTRVLRNTPYEALDLERQALNRAFVDTGVTLLQREIPTRH